MRPKREAETVVAQSKGLKDKLSAIEGAMKDTRLWFVLPEPLPTHGVLQGFAGRCGMANGRKGRKP